jgi:hypothetical protein
MDDGRSRRISSDASPLGQCTENGFLDKEGAKLQEATKRSTRADAVAWNLMEPNGSVTQELLSKKVLQNDVPL